MGFNYSEGHICQCLSRILFLRRDFPVTICRNREKNGKKFVESVLSLARGLSELGLRPGDIVGIAAFNSDWYLQWLLAVAFVGGIAAPLNYRWSFEEARTAMVAVKPVMLVIDESCNFWYTKIQSSNLVSLRWHVFLGDPCLLSNNYNVLTMETLEKHSQSFSPFDYQWAPEGIVLICFTSGTTGRPKGVAITHTALIVQSLAKVAIAGYGEDDVYLHTAPLCHIGGISSAMAMLMVGACHVLIPKFEAESALKAIERYYVSSLITIPAMMVDLISFTRKKESWKGGKNVKKILNGGGGLSFEIIREAIKVFPHAKLISAYGMTETCSSLTFMTLHDPIHENSGKSNQKISKTTSDNSHRPTGACVGKPAPHVELRICGEGSSTVGRILTRGPHVMLRYWDQIPAMVSDSQWLDTGDIGCIDNNGDVWLIGRTKDRIKSGGENVNPEEVEAVLSQHPGVSSIIVVGIPDPRLSEMLAACVQIRENWKWADQKSYHSAKPEELRLSSQILQNYCKQKNLTGFKIPKIFILWRKQFPLTTTGKLRRDEVRREAILQLQFLSSNL